MKTSLLFKLFFSALVLVIVIPMVFPFFWMFMSSIKSQVDIISWPPKFIFSPTTKNFYRVFTEHNFFLYLKNSSIVGFSAVFFSLLIGLDWITLTLSPDFASFFSS